MGKIFETKINKFDGGMTNDLRSKDLSKSRVLRHFDVFSSGEKMTPYLSMEADGSTGDTEKLTLFLTAGTTQANTIQYGLGVVSASSKAKVFERASAPSGTWSGSTTGESSSGARSEKLFVLYKDGSNNNVIYGARAGTHIWSYRIDNDTFNDTERAITHTDIAQGLVHSKDDNLYIPYDNKIAKKDAGTWTNEALTLPLNTIVTSIAEYGNYLAIATKPKYVGGRSTIYLWNRDDSLTTLSEKIDWGTDDLQIIEELGGFLIGISTTAATSVVIEPKVSFKVVTGSGTRKLFEINATDTTVQFGRNCQKLNNRIYFMMLVEINNFFQMGVWSVAMNESGQFALSLDRLLNNGDTTFTASDLPKGFQLLGDFMTVAFDDGGTFVIRVTDAAKTDFSSAFSDYESLILNGGDSDLTKKLIGATVMFEPLPANGAVTLDFKADEDSSFTTIYSAFTTDNAISHGAINIESSGGALPEYKEIQFRIRSKGKAVITGMKFKYELVGKELY